jgi:class 3 adenylate cyclase
LNGEKSTFLGKGDLHNPKYDYMMINETFTPFLQQNKTDSYSSCVYNFQIYPTNVFEEQYTSNNPLIFCMVVVFVFGFTVVVFAIYDCLVQRRQSIVMATAQHTDKIISSLFPKNVRDRIMEDAKDNATNVAKKSLLSSAPRTQLKTFLDDGSKENGQLFNTKPIAELFPETTILFGDIVGFTAWSSVREPSQVFTLLETVYHAFDEIARKRRVFKVETIGDCYVAVTGLPEPQHDHAAIMARFAKDIMVRMRVLTKQLELSLGPDTADLCMRVGLHSGPVTAGVLRGQKSRFQLFGDTVNTAARIESTGERDKIHISSETAKLLIDSGKGHWVLPREDLVVAKGKGVLKTYWLELRPRSGHTTSSKSNSDASTSNDGQTGEEIDGNIESNPQLQAFKIDSKNQRLIDWNTDILARLLKLIVSRRREMKSNSVNDSIDESITFHQPNQSVLDEVKQIIHLPDFDAATCASEAQVELDDNIMSQLRSLVNASKCHVDNRPMYRTLKCYCPFQCSHR